MRTCDLFVCDSIETKTKTTLNSVYKIRASGTGVCSRCLPPITYTCFIDATTSKRRVLGYSSKVHPERLIQSKKRSLWIHSEHQASVFYVGIWKKVGPRSRLLAGCRMILTLLERSTEGAQVWLYAMNALFRSFRLASVYLDCFRGIWTHINVCTTSLYTVLFTVIFGEAFEYKSCSVYRGT